MKSLDMQPSFASDNWIDGPNRNIESLRQLCRCCAFFTVAATNLGNVSFVKFGLMVLGAVRDIPTPFFVHIVRVIFVCSCKKMFGVAARRIVAGMADLIAFRDWANMQFVGIAMRANRLSVHAEFPVAIGVNPSDPGPTFFVGADLDIFPESFCRRATVDVFWDKTKGLTSEDVRFAVGVFGYWRGFATATFAQFDWRGRNGLCCIVPIDIAQWFAFDPAAARIALWGNLGLLPATALAIAGWVRRVRHNTLSTVMTENEPSLLAGVLGRGKQYATSTFAEFWGIIGAHRELAFLVSKPRAFRDAAGHFLLALYSFNYNMFERVQQGR